MKKEALKLRLRLIRQIHRQKLGDSIDVSDVKKTDLPKPSEIFSEKECWKCGKIQKRSLCVECKQELKDNNKILKPEIETVPEVDIESIFVDFLKFRSLYDLFTREQVLGENIGNRPHMQSFMVFVKTEMLNCRFEKIMSPGNTKYRLTASGVEYFTQKINM